MRPSVVVSVLCCCMAGGANVFGGDDSLRLSITRPQSDGWVHLNASVRSNQLYQVKVSSNLVTWTTLALAHERLVNYPDASPTAGQRFYRLLTQALGPNDEVKNQIYFPLDSFRSATAGANEVRWIKFAILTREPWRVYYQPSAKYLFHYDFATRYLPPFAGMSAPDFDVLTLYTNNQAAILGAVLFPPSTNVLEFGIQFSGFDPYPPQDVARWFEIVRATVAANNTAQAFYVPSPEQRTATDADREFFAERGIVIGTGDRWTPNEQCYAAGWALGRLVFVSGNQIQSAYTSGQLTATDILVTDVVPAEVPFLAGIISLSPSTPNSHVAILSRSFGTPFVYLPRPQDHTNILALVNREVLLRADSQSSACNVKILDTEGHLDASARQQLLALKAPRPLNIPPKERFGQYWASTDLLTPRDIRFFGGKAANFGLLRRSVPTNSPTALAFSFDLWDDFMDQILPNGTNTLRAEIAGRLASFTNYPPNLETLQAVLSGIRGLITSSATFTPQLRVVITNALAGFNPGRKIRFRSSTNMEDSDQFTGAGLYDSFSGCLLDDLDGDTAGPSHCDPDENNERGVFRAIQKVYASFYNDNAFLERLRHGMDETRIAMGVLVHYSFPDEEELANGVATVQYTGANMQFDLVSQLGAESVTNPDGSSLPETVRATRFGATVSLDLTQYSSRVPLGGSVLNWEDDYRSLINLLVAVTEAYRAFYTNKTRFLLDFEYKKTAEGLALKQVREIPAAATNSWIPFLINEPLQFRVFQGESGTVFGNHRLKSLWNLETANLELNVSNLANSFHTTAQIEYLKGTNLQHLGGAIGSFPNFTYSHGVLSLLQEITTNQWTMGAPPNQQLWSLTTILPTRINEPKVPVITQSDLSNAVNVQYPAGVPVIQSGSPRTVTNETIRLEVPPPPDSESLLQTRTFTGSNGVQITTVFHWPTPPNGGFVAGYTAPLLKWDHTLITGLSSNAITLRGYYSQTYRPGHHNFDEEFMFEPRLEPNLPADTLPQLEAGNIQAIYTKRFLSGNIAIWILGLDQQFRRIY